MYVFVRAQGSATVAAALEGVGTPGDVITPPSVFAAQATPREPYTQLEQSHRLYFECALEDCNAALASLLYQGDLNWNSANKNQDQLVLVVQEVATTGVGVPTNDTRFMYVEVLAVNDAPVLHAPGECTAPALAPHCSCVNATQSCAIRRCPFATV